MIRGTAAGLGLAVLAGCATPPVDVTATGEPALIEIHAALERAVERADDDPALHWHSGHVGNAFVNFWGANNRGLCYHWQQHTYGQVVATVDRVGWEACGVAINCGTDNEHHAVLVWDPARVSGDEIADALPGVPPGAPTYVLDPWRHGRADVWPLDAWIAIPERVRTPPELEVLSPAGEPPAP